MGKNVYKTLSGSVIPSVIERINSEIVVGNSNTGCFFVDEDFSENPNVNYHYWITAVNKKNKESLYSTEVTCAGNVFDHDSDLVVIAPSDGSGGVSSTPTFTWRNRTGASAYCILLQHGAGAGNYPLWIHRVSDTSIAYSTSAVGIDYINPAYTTLPDSTYRWQVFAINEDNVTFAELEAYFTTGN